LSFFFLQEIRSPQKTIIDRPGIQKTCLLIPPALKAFSKDNDSELDVEVVIAEVSKMWLC
jgi:hypothetical protein